MAAATIAAGSGDRNESGDSSSGNYSSANEQRQRRATTVAVVAGARATSRVRVGKSREEG